LDLTPDQQAAARSCGCAFFPATDAQVERLTMQRRIFRLEGRPFLVTRDGAYWETHGTLMRLIEGRTPRGVDVRPAPAALMTDSDEPAPAIARHEAPPPLAEPPAAPPPPAEAVPTTCPEPSDASADAEKAEPQAAEAPSAAPPRPRARRARPATTPTEEVAAATVPGPDSDVAATTDAEAPQRRRAGIRRRGQQG
jgi:hypothetical protein